MKARLSAHGLKYFMIIILSLLTFTPTLTIAEQSACTSYLMNEPASLMDLALYKIYVDLTRSSDKLKFDEEEPIFITTYDWYSDKILIEAYYFKDDKNKLKVFDDSVRKEAEALLKKIKWWIGYNPEKKLFAEPIQARLLGYFDHAGYEAKKRPFNLPNLLINIIAVKANIELKDGLVTCGSVLSDTDFYWNLNLLKK